MACPRHRRTAGSGELFGETLLCTFHCKNNFLLKMGDYFCFEFCSEFPFRPVFQTITDCFRCLARKINPVRALLCCKWLLQNDDGRSKQCIHLLNFNRVSRLNSRKLLKMVTTRPQKCSPKTVSNFGDVKFLTALLSSSVPHFDSSKCSAFPGSFDIHPALMIITALPYERQLRG